MENPLNINYTIKQINNQYKLINDFNYKTLI